MPNYRVVFHEEVIREYEVENCRTPEEAEVIALDLREEDSDRENESEKYPQGHCEITSSTTEIEELEEA